MCHYTWWCGNHNKHNWEHPHTSYLTSHQVSINNQSNNPSQIWINCGYMNTLPEILLYLNIPPNEWRIRTLFNKYKALSKCSMEIRTTGHKYMFTTFMCELVKYSWEPQMPNSIHKFHSRVIGTAGAVFCKAYS